MGYDHAEQKELEHPVESPNPSSSNSETKYEPPNEKQEQWQDSRRDTVKTVADDEATEDNQLQLKNTHTHQFGILKMRADDDDDPIDWWFASTAIPLIAATFAPMANVLSIAALIVPWRNTLTTTGPTAEATSVGYGDPHWCIALNIASLACGFVGNLFLLFNFTKRVRYIVALPTTIVLFYASSGILIGITSSMAIYVPPGPNDVYSQGYWYGVIAACLYMFNSVILMINMLGYFLGHYPQHFTLTDEQRNLILQTMLFFVWLAGGAGVFSTIEGWEYPDALYFCDVTILTIGFGDFYATNDVGRGLVFPFSVGGTIILGLMVSSIHRFAGELSKDKVIRRHVESKRVNTLSRAVTVSPEDEANEKRREEKEKNMDFRPGHRPNISSPLTEKDLSERQIAFQETKEKVVSPAREEQPSKNQFLSSKFHRGPIHMTIRIIAVPVMQLRKATTRSQKEIIMRQEKDRFDAMRSIQKEAQDFKKWYALSMSALAFGLLWCVGAIVFWRVEQNTQGLSYFQSLYFCYVSLLTIGYGDLSPKSNAGKPFFVVWSLIAVPTMTILISDMGDTVIKAFKHGTFKLADFTVLPKQGLWHDIMEAHPWLWDWIQRRIVQKRIEKGFEVGPAMENGGPDLLPPQSIRELANEHLSEAELTKRLAYAIRKTADDLRHNEHHRYMYEEWVEFTRLIRFTKTTNTEDLEHDEEKDGVVDWDWLDENSPMLSEQSEPEWVLDRLCESLLRLLKKNNLGVVPTPEERLPGQFDEVNYDNSSRKVGIDDGDIDPKAGSIIAQQHIENKPTPTQERQRRASGADAVLTFFTGARRGEHAYATSAPKWSKKGHEKNAERRRRSSTTEKRRGPFSRMHVHYPHMHHGGAARGGGRGGAGARTMKAKSMSYEGGNANPRPRPSESGS